MAGHRVPLRVYYSIFAALLVLTAITVWVAHVDLGLWSDLVAMTIAVAKAMLVVLFFMHLRYSDHLVWIFAAAGALWLVILIGITISDYLSRGW